MLVAGCMAMQGIETVFSVPEDGQAGPPVPAPFLFASASAYVALAIFGVLRSPFQLTAKIDALNTLYQQQQRLQTSGSSEGSEASSLGEQLEQLADPEAPGSVREGMQRVSRAQWLKPVGASIDTGYEGEDLPREMPP
jgi:hypothetical protein